MYSGLDRRYDAEYFTTLSLRFSQVSAHQPESHQLGLSELRHQQLHFTEYVCSTLSLGVMKVLCYHKIINRLILLAKKLIKASGIAIIK